MALNKTNRALLYDWGRLLRLHGIVLIVVGALVAALQIPLLPVPLPLLGGILLLGPMLAAFPLGSAVLWLGLLGLCVMAAFAPGVSVPLRVLASLIAVGLVVLLAKRSAWLRRRLLPYVTTLLAAWALAQTDWRDGITVASVLLLWALGLGLAAGAQRLWLKKRRGTRLKALRAGFQNRVSEPLRRRIATTRKR